MRKYILLLCITLLASCEKENNIPTVEGNKWVCTAKNIDESRAAFQIFTGSSYMGRSDNSLIAVIELVSDTMYNPYIILEDNSKFTMDNRRYFFDSTNNDIILYPMSNLAENVDFYDKDIFIKGKRTEDKMTFEVKLNPGFPSQPTDKIVKLEYLKQ